MKDIDAATKPPQAASEPVMSAPFLLDPTMADAPFPPVELALREPNGLLAIGGSLEPARLLNAYRSGVFPWYSEGQPILWWSPDPRSVLRPDEVHVSRSLRKTLRQGYWRVTSDCAFERVVAACATIPRPYQDGTWIVADMHYAYVRLHRLGWAHSVEVWRGSRLVGGLYGIAIGEVFFGESMFSAERDASKVALVHLAAWLHDWGYALIDCQVETAHLNRLGARNLPRRAFVDALARHCSRLPRSGWAPPRPPPARTPGGAAP